VEKAKEKRGLALAEALAIGWPRPAQESCLPRSDDPIDSVAQSSAGARDDARVDDRALAEACRSGSLAAYEQLYHSHAPKMKSIAMNLLGNATDAEDVVQEVFLKIHRGVGKFKGESAFSTWVYRILVNSCYDVRRKRMRRQESSEQAIDEEGTPEPPAPHSDHPLRLALERFVAELPPDHREAFVLFEVEGFKHAEIAAMVGISETASKNRLFQAKQQLRRMLLETGKLTRYATP
jgi:RNA polymerase sigma-70 factor (ECF subfamily)